MKTVLKPLDNEDFDEDKNHGRLTRTCQRCRQEIVIWRGDNAPPVSKTYTCFRCKDRTLEDMDGS